MQIETLDRRHLTEAEARPLAELLNKVFTKRSLDERVAKLLTECGNYSGPEAVYPRSIVLREG